VDKKARYGFTLPIDQLAAGLSFLSCSLEFRAELIAPSNASSLNGLPKRSSSLSESFCAHLIIGMPCYKDHRN
jgi:hypothetical protein